MTEAARIMESQWTQDNKEFHKITATMLDEIATILERGEVPVLELIIYLRSMANDYRSESALHEANQITKDLLVP